MFQKSLSHWTLKLLCGSFAHKKQPLIKELSTIFNANMTKCQFSVVSKTLLDRFESLFAFKLIFNNIRFRLKNVFCTSTNLTVFDFGNNRFLFSNPSQ